MIIRKKDDIYIIKIINNKYTSFDYFNPEKIKELFESILKKIKKKYDINGLLDTDVYINDYYGIIIEIKPIYQDLKEIDMHIHFHIDCIFMNEINENIVSTEKEVYYYKNKFYTIYNKLYDSNIIYKTENILENGIRINN